MKIKTILVVEDNKLNMKLVKGLIKIGKYRMLEANDAESGIEQIREKQPDLVLMDIQLPGMDGLSATKVIKEDPDLKDIPIVALTSFAMQGDEEKALAVGCTGYITKPIDTRKFLETVSQYLKDDNLQRKSCEGMKHEI
jgi:CheY-like chemotaxis protein